MKFARITVIVVGILAILITVDRVQAGIRGARARNSRASPVALASARASAVRSARNDAVLQYRVRLALDRLEERSGSRETDGPHVVLDRGLPRDLADAAAQAAALQWADLGDRASSSRAMMLVFSDTSQMVLGRDVGGAMPPVQIVNVLPTTTGRPECISVVRVTPGSADAIPMSGLWGVCGFHAAFGSPGRRLQAWLDSAAHLPAAIAEWERGAVVASAPTLRNSRLGASALVGQCVMGDDSACVRAVFRTYGASEGAAATDDIVTGDVRGLVILYPGRGMLASGGNGRRFFSDLAREMGADRFATFWTSNDEVSVAFERAFGTPLADWARRWLAREYDDAPGGPAVTPAGLAWAGALAIGGLVVGMARRRERLAP